LPEKVHLREAKSLPLKRQGAEESKGRNVAIIPSGLCALCFLGGLCVSKTGAAGAAGMRWIFANSRILILRCCHGIWPGTTLFYI
jgi:hypothetical protein